MNKVEWLLLFLIVLMHGCSSEPDEPRDTAAAVAYPRIDLTEPPVENELTTKEFLQLSQAEQDEVRLKAMNLSPADEDEMRKIMADARQNPKKYKGDGSSLTSVSTCAICGAKHKSNDDKWWSQHLETHNEGNNEKASDK